MRIAPPRLAVVLLGDRLCAAIVQRDRAEMFVVQAETPAAALRAELEARGLAPRAARLALMRAAVTAKPVDLPPVGGELREMVRFELERHLPFPADDAPFDFVSLAPEGEAGPPATRRVLVAAAERRVLDAALRLAEDAKLRPLSVTVAAHDLLALVRPPRGQRVLWVHKTGDTADLLLVGDGALVGSRSLPAGDLAWLAEDARRSLAPVRWRGCDGVWASGDDAEALGGALAALGAPVTAPPYTPRARRRLAALGAAGRGAAELALAVASGRGVRPLDLLPPAMRPRHLTRHQWTTVGIAAAALLLAFGALLAPGIHQHRRLAALNAEIAWLDPEVRAVDRLLGELESKRQILKTVADAETTAIRPLPVLRELTELLPPDAWLTMLGLDAKGVELTGQAAQASLLIPLLENSPRFEHAEFASPVTRGRDKEQFRIHAAWETPPGRATPAPASAPPAPRTHP